MIDSENKRINFRTLLAIAIRSFFLQACWNFQRMQNLGFAFAINPLINKLARTQEQKLILLKRHLEFFNTHPYCVSLILGVVCHTEEELFYQGEQDVDAANRLKVSMMGPLAALGDTVFWAMLKPAMALLGVSFVLLSPWGQSWPALLGPVLFLVLFSIPHISLQVGGVFVGYQRGLEIVKDLRRFNPQLIAQRIGFFIAVILGAILAIYTYQQSMSWTASRLLGTGILLGVLGLNFLGLRHGISATYLFYGWLSLAILLAYCGVL